MLVYPEWQVDCDQWRLFLGNIPTSVTTEEIREVDVFDLITAVSDAKPYVPGQLLIGLD